MINLCYLKEKISDQEEFYEQFLTTVFPHVDIDTDLIITSERIKPRPGTRMFCFEELDLETLWSLPLKNIFLVEFDYISSSYIRSLISMKSKKSEIVGVSNYCPIKLKDAKLLADNFRECGYSSDQIKIALILNYNYHPNIVDKIASDSLTNKLSNIKIKELDNIEDIVKFIKR